MWLLQVLMSHVQCKGNHMHKYHTHTDRDQQITTCLQKDRQATEKEHISDSPRCSGTCSYYTISSTLLALGHTSFNIEGATSHPGSYCVMQLVYFMPGSFSRLVGWYVRAHMSGETFETQLSSQKNSPR